MTQPRVRVVETRLGRELRVDGTLASVMRPGRAGTRPVWDAQAAPLLALPPRRRRKVLILGLGAGSSARLLRRLAPEALIVGVEMDGEVLAAARQAFGLDALGLELHVADARDVLASERRRFDLVIEDVFVGNARSVRKPDWMLRGGLARAWKLVAKGGLLAVNTIHEGVRVRRVLERFGQPILAIGIRDYWNRILVTGEPLPDASEFRRRVGAEPELRESLRAFEIETVSAGRPFRGPRNLG